MSRPPVTSRAPKDGTGDGILSGIQLGGDSFVNLVHIYPGADQTRQATGQGASALLSRDVVGEAMLLERRILDERRRALDLVAQINAKLAQLDAQLVGMLSQQATPGNTIMPPHTAALAYLRVATKMSKDRIGALIGVSRQTVHNWEKGQPIASAKRMHLLAVRDVIERATLLYTSVGELAAWIDTPRGVDGHTPAQLLELGEFDKARLLAITRPSPGIKHLQARPSIGASNHSRIQRPMSALPIDEDDLYLEEDEGSTEFAEVKEAP